MKLCQNCGATITCGCQERVASDGKQVCANCISLYEQTLVNKAVYEQTLANNNVLNENSSTP